jgi:pSer/pThr/pTyr-binding forkhead associated (FHA) protein
VIREAQARGIAIDSIGLTRTSPLWLPYLSTLSLTTGGTFHQVHSDQELQTLISNGMARLKASPLATFEVQHLSGDGEAHRISVRWRGTPTLTGDTTFTAPSVGGWRGLRDKLTNLPDWAYPLAAFAVLLLIVGLIALFRSLAKPKRTVAPAPARVPVQSPPPPAPAPLAPRNRTPTIADVSPSATQYESRPQPPVARPVTTEATPSPPSPQPSPAVKKKTQLVGFFDGTGNVIATIEGLAGSLAGRRIDVSKSEFWLGAAADNDLVIENDPTVSSRHACLIFQDRLLMIADNHSTNGIRVNGEVLRGSRRPVKPGDQIQIGRSLCVIRSAE